MLKKRGGSSNDSKDLDVSKEIDQDKKEEGAIVDKTKRSREDVKALFKENYLKEAGIDTDDAAYKESGLDKKLDKVLDMLTERELSNSKNMSKVIGQKIKYRDLVGGGSQKSVPDKRETDTDTNEESTTRDVERKKGAAKFLTDVMKEFKEEGLTEGEVYEKIRAEYREADSDVTRADFYKRCDAAFNHAYPKLHEERIKRAERKDSAQDDVPRPGGGSSGDDKKAPRSSKVPKHASRKGPTDWFKKKK